MDSAKIIVDAPKNKLDLNNPIGPKRQNPHVSGIVNSNPLRWQFVSFWVADKRNLGILIPICVDFSSFFISSGHVAYHVEAQVV